MINYLGKEINFQRAFPFTLFLLVKTSAMLNEVAMLSILCRRRIYDRPPTKLQESNVLIHVRPSVSQSVCAQGVPMWPFPWCIGLHCTGPWLSQPQLQSHPLALAPSFASPASDTWWSSLGDLLKLVHLRTPPRATSGGYILKFIRSVQAGVLHPTGMPSCFYFTN